MRTPDIEQVYKVLRREKPDRPVLFEIFLNTPLYERLAGREAEPGMLERLRLTVDAYAAAGYDYATSYGSEICFPTKGRAQKESASLNEGAIITGRDSFDAYVWPEPESFDDSHLDKIEPFLPGNMKLMVMGPGGVLENAIALVGYDNLCFLLADDEPLAARVFDEIGSRLVRYYERAASHKSVGFLMANDDWGFNTQTFLSPAQMRKYVFPWHKKIVEVAHKHGLPCVLHSCGNLERVMDDVIDDMKFDGKHSYEDNILPVEDAYRRWGDRIAVLGGIDMNFLCRSTPDAIRARCRNMLALAEKGGYALGSGNSVPEYVPVENYFAMTSCALG